MPEYCERSGKQCFPSIGHATRALKRLHGKGFPYICYHCHLFHITLRGTFESKKHKTQRHSLQDLQAKELLDDN